MTTFYPLRVQSVQRETTDCVSVTFEVPTNLKATFRYLPGQYLTLRTQLEGEEVRRSYSICSAVTDAHLRVAIKKLPGGRFSTFANDQLQAGDTLEVMPPMGRFTLSLDADRAGHYVGFAAGSGITPVMSILKSVLTCEPQSRFTLFFGNRTTDSIIFREDLEALKNRFLNRLSLHHILSREHTGSDLFSGRIDGQKTGYFLDHLIDPEAVDGFFICGPERMIHDLRDQLYGRGIDRKKVHFELFGTSADTPKRQPSEEATEVEATIVLTQDGNQFEFPLSSQGETILDAALKAGADLPYACKGGVCSTCRARLVAGQIEMDVNYALEPDEVEAGFILACQAHPVSSRVEVDFDA